MDVGGPTHATPKRGPLHISLGKFDMSLPLPMSMQQMKALPRVCPGQPSARSAMENTHSSLAILQPCSGTARGQSCVLVQQRIMEEQA